MDPQQQQYLRRQLIKHIEGGEAFLPLEDILPKIPFEKTGVVPADLPYSLWQIVYHIRFAQKDILEFSRNPEYVAPQWPDDYWPTSVFPENHELWESTVHAYYKERDEFISLIMNPKVDLFEPFGHGEGQTVFREALLVIEHTGYHAGQLVVLLRLLGLY